MKLTKKILCSLLCLIMVFGSAFVANAGLEAPEIITLAKATEMKNNKDSFIVFFYDSSCDNYSATNKAVDKMWDSYKNVYAVDLTKTGNNPTWTDIPADFQGKHIVVFVDGGSVDSIDGKTGVFECTSDDDSIAEMNAYFIKFKDEHTLTYNANGGTGGPASQKGNGKITLSSLKPTREGYEFAGWATSASASEKAYDAGAEFNLTSDTTLYAVWKASSGYYVTFHDAEGKNQFNPISISVENGVYYVDIPVTYVPKSTSGVTFKGWKYKKDLTERVAQAGERLVLEKLESVTVSAVWSDPINASVSDVDVNYIICENSHISINDGLNKKINYKERVHIIATVTNLPDGAEVSIYPSPSRGKALKTEYSNGGTVTVEYISEKLDRDTGFTVNVYQNDKICCSSDGTPLRSRITVQVKTGFFQKVRAAFYDLFGISPIVEIR